MPSDSEGELLSQAFQFGAGSMRLVKVRWAVPLGGAQQRNRRRDLSPEKSGLSGVEIRRANLFGSCPRIGVVGGGEHRLLVDPSQMEIDDRRRPSPLFEFGCIDF
jgi:hypothetical protein